MKSCQSLFLNRCIQKKAFVILVFLFFASALFSQNQHFTFDSSQREVYHQAVQLKTVCAKKGIASIQKRDPGNLATWLSEEAAEFYAVIALSSKEAFEYYKTRSEERIKAFEMTTVQSPFVQFTLAECYLHRAILRVMFGEKFKAVFDLKKARFYTLKNIREYPAFSLNNKPLSLIDIILGSIPVSFKWASDLVSLKGDYNQGVKELDRLLAYTYVNKEYGCFFYEVLTCKVIVVQQSSAASDGSEQLDTYFATLTIKKELPVNHLLLYAWSDYLIKKGQNEKAYRLLRQQVKNSDYLIFWPIEFLKGVALQNRLDKGCVFYFNAYIQGVRKGNCVNACYQRLAWQSLVNGDIRGYYLHLNHVDIRFQNSEQDQAACYDFQNKFIPCSQLLKVRLLFDGGYYEAAFGEIGKINPEKLTNKLYVLEYYYRLGRIYDRRENYTQAIYFYDKVILEGGGGQSYYAANASLHAGMICEMLQDKPKARSYYQKALSIDPSQYKAGIHQKAKIRLQRL